MANTRIGKEISLNFDILSHIVTFVPSTRDLLAICLTNKILLGLAEPELAYRVIKCQLINVAVWEKLCNPANAARVRKLEIQDSLLYDWNSGQNHRLERIPSEIHWEAIDISTSSSLDVIERSESLLIQAVSKMVNLESFRWDPCVPVIIQGEKTLWFQNGTQNDEGPVYADDIWTTLHNYTSLKFLTVNYHVGLEFQHMRWTFNSTLFTLKNLTAVNLSIGFFIDNYEDDHHFMDEGRGRALCIQNLLSQCPNLEDLCLAIADEHLMEDEDAGSYAYLDNTFSSNHWPHLKTLTLQDVIVEENSMIDFLRRHPGLTSLTVCLSRVRKAQFGREEPFYPSHKWEVQSILPNLTHVALPPDLLRPLLRSMHNPTTLQSINYLQPRHWVYIPPKDGLELPNNRWLHEKDPILAVCMPNLRSLTVRNFKDIEELDRLIRLTPNLEHLMVIKSIKPKDISELSNSDRHFDILQRLCQWRKIVSFTGVSLWTSQTMAQESPEVLSVAAEAVRMCPTLQKVSWIHGRTATFVKDVSQNFLRLDLSA